MAAPEQNPGLILHPGESTNHQRGVVHGVYFSEPSVVQRNGSETETGEGRSRRNRIVRTGGESISYHCVKGKMEMEAWRWGAA